MRALNNRTFEKVAGTTGRSGVGRAILNMGLGNVVALLFIFAVVLIAVAAPFLAPEGYSSQNYDALAEGISSEHWLGTDNLGRDIQDRLIYGARVSLTSAAVAVSVGLLVGVPVGLLAVFGGRFADTVSMRLVDTLISFPAVVLAIAVIAVLGTGTINAMIAVGVVLSPAFARLTRAQALVVRDQHYVEAASTFGASAGWTIRRHIVPNAIQPVIVLTAQFLGVALLIEATLSFLGLGVQPPIPSWGSMLREASRYADGVAVQLIAPGLAIALTLLAINQLGDWLRDVLDPVMRDRMKSDRLGRDRKTDDNAREGIEIDIPA